MANRKQFKITLQPKIGPAHLDGLVAWGSSDPVCPKCNKDDEVYKRNGEWFCRRCVIQFER